MRRRSVQVLLSFVVAAAVSGCAGGEQGTDQANEPATLTVGVIPITPVAPVYLGIEKGFFKEENLTVRPQLAQGGAAIIPSVQSGDYQIGFSNSVSLMIAHTEGLPVQVIAPGESSPAEASDDNSAIMVPDDSPIREPGDLEGKTIGVNTLQNIAGLTTEASLAKRGVDVSTIDLVEVPFPEMLQAINNGEVDAGFFNEPFTTLAEQDGARTIVNPYAGTAANIPIAPYFAMRPYIEENRDVIERFQRAMAKATQYALDNPDETRRILLTYTEIPEDVVKEIGLPHLETELQPEGFEVLADTVHEFGYTETTADVGELLLADGS